MKNICVYLYLFGFVAGISTMSLFDEKDIKKLKYKCKNLEYENVKLTNVINGYNKKN
jgi:hypothetical protein